MSDVVPILNRGYELIWREDRLEDALARLSPEFEWVVPNHPEGAVRHGPDAVLAFFRELMDPFKELRVEWEIQEVAPGSALAIIDMRGRGRSSGAPVEMRFAQLWTFRGRTAERMVLYDDVDEARRAAGL